MSNYKQYFGFKIEPFEKEISAKKLLKLPNMIAVKERIDYISKIGGVMVVTGEVGSGKSTSLRWAISHYHQSQYKIVNVIGNNGSIIEFYKQLCWAIDLDLLTNSRTRLIKMFKSTIQDIVLSQKQNIIIIIDEASLLKHEIFAELQILLQFENDSKNMLSVVFAGQVGLIDKLKYRGAAALASRVIAKTHLNGINTEQMKEYLQHHLKIAGVKEMLFPNEAVTAIQQGSGGLLRKANHLARGSLIAAANENKSSVTAEHIRIASTELLY